MDIITLIKQTPDTAQLSKTMNGLQLMREGGPRILNPWDEYTLETGIQLKEAHGGTVTILCLGQPDSAEAIKRGLAMGADAAYLISDPALAGSALAVEVDEYRVLGVLLAADGGVTRFDARTGAPAGRLPAWPQGSGATAFARDPRSGRFAVAFADGSLRFGRLGFETQIPEDAHVRFVFTAP